MTNTELAILQTTLDMLPLTTPHDVCVFCLDKDKPFWDEPTQMWLHSIIDDSAISCRRRKL